MTQLRSKFDLEDLDEAQNGGKTLPNSFRDTRDEVSLRDSIIASLLIHPLTIVLIWLIITILALIGIDFKRAERPDWKERQNIEFVLVQNEAEPINKKTPYRSDRNSRAGGKHDPTRKVSMPSPAPAPAPSKQPAPQPKRKAQPKPSIMDNIQRAVQKPVQKPAPAPKKTPPKPSKAAAPSAQRPVYKPSAQPPKPAMPKLSAAPKSPFSVAVPKTSAPVGPRPQAGSGTSRGSSGGSAGGSSSGRGYMPAPQLASRGTGSGSRTGGGRPNSRGGGYGTGNMGNPGPGNPSGPPGIDAIKSPDWGPYMRDLERRIKRNWNPPKGDASKRVVVLFKIGRDGRLLSIRVGKSSGSVANDDAAKAAIELTAPFRPLPPEFKGSSIDIEFTFDYNVLGASYR